MASLTKGGKMNNLEKGIPYEEAVHRLDKAFAPKPGDLITHDELREVIQADDRRYYGVLGAWRRRLAKRGLWAICTGPARGVGLLICDGRQHAAWVDREIAGTAKKARKAAKGAKDVDATGFSDAERSQHSIRVRFADAIADSAKKAEKEIAAATPPAPVSAQGNVRLLRSA